MANSHADLTGRKEQPVPAWTVSEDVAIALHDLRSQEEKNNAVSITRKLLFALLRDEFRSVGNPFFRLATVVPAKTTRTTPLPVT